MSDWFVIVSEATQNKSVNPSAEIAGNFGNVAGGTVTRVTTASFFGVRAYRLVTGANNDGGTFTLDTLNNAIHYVTMRVRGTLPPSWDWSLDNAAFTAPVLLKTYDADWALYGLQFPAAQANGSTTLRVYQGAAGAGDFNIDGIQVEEKEYWTSFCDGDQEGCEWNSAAHASASQRSAQSRAGGRVRDLQDDYHLDIRQFISTGMPPLDLAVDSYAILPGGELNSVKVMSRVFTLTGVIRGTSVANLHANRQALLNVLKPGAVPGDQPVRIRYTGAAVVKEIAAHYEGGLETSIMADMECWERVAIRFLADDPFWYEIGESAEELDEEDGATLRYVAGRLRSTGQWDDLGLTNPPTGGGVINAIAIAPDNSVYVGGNFGGMDNVGGRDYIARYIPSTDTWETVGPGGSVNGTIWAIAVAPNGDIYVGGSFLNLGGGTGDYVAYWDVSGGVWSPVAAGGQGTVRGLAFGPDGTLYIVGAFLNWNALPDGDYIVSWNGAAYASLGTAGDGTIFSVTVDGSGVVYVGGNFVNIGGGAAVRIAAWDGTNWNALSTGMNGIVYAVLATEDDTLYAAGVFTTAGGIAAIRVASWNGTAWSALGAGVNSTASDLAVGPDGILYIGGVFTAAGGIDLVQGIAKWNGSSWTHLDVDLPGVAAVFAIALGEPDSVVEQNYDIYLGFDISGAGTFAGDVTVTNNGTESAYPRIVVSRSGGTNAILEEVRNETTGKELLFDYALLDGETLTIDLMPTAKSIVSSFFGLRPDAILPNSDFGSFALQPGNNLITCFIDTDATIEVFLVWESTFWSSD